MKQDDDAVDLTAGDELDLMEDLPEMEAGDEFMGDGESTPGNEETVAKSRYDNAVKKMNESNREAAELRKRLAEMEGMNSQPTEQAPISLSDAAEEASQEIYPIPDDEEVAEWLELYPEITRPMLKINEYQFKYIVALRKELDELKGNVSPIFSEYSEKQKAAKEAEESAQKEMLWSKILEKHPDAKDIDVSEEFDSWFNSASPVIQGAIKGGNPDEISTALDLFKASRGSKPKESPETTPDSEEMPEEGTAPDVSVAIMATKPDEKESKLEKAKKVAPPAVKQSAKPMEKKEFTREQIGKMNTKEFEANKDAIFEAMRNGSIA